MKYLILFLLLTACTAPRGDPGVPIANFHKVDEFVYRGAQPDQKGMEYLKSIGVKTVVDLNVGLLVSLTEYKWARDLGIEYRAEPMSGWLPDHSDEQNLTNALQVLSNPKYAPVYIHCELGEDRTGLAVALYRVWFNKWDRNKAYEEWVALGHNRFLFIFDLVYWRLTTGWV